MHLHHEKHSMPVDHEMGQCKMNMVFTWDYNNVCVVFSWWRITSFLSLIVTCATIVACSMAYEGLRSATKRYESREERSKNVCSALYALQVFWSFFIMLVFMTYNGWLMAAVTFGAYLGHQLFSTGRNVRGLACH